MNPFRKIHFSRLLDIVSGSAFASATNKTERSKIYRDFDQAKLTDKRFREIITANLPIFYVVDAELIADEIINGLVSDPNRFISSIGTSLGPTAPGEAGFDALKAKFVKDYNSAKRDIQQLVLTTLTSKISKKSFAAVYDDIETIYLKTIQSLSQTGKRYDTYRNAAIRMGFDIRSKLNSVGIFIAQDAANIINITPTQLLIIGPTFDAATRKVNDSLLNPIEKLLEDKYKIVVNKGNTGFKIGNIVNAGHTSAVTASGDTIAVNMPSAQEKQFLLAGNPKAFELEQELGALYAGINYTITFTENFKGKAGNLADMQFAFVVSMPADLNTKSLNVAERARIKAVIQEELLPTLAEQIKAKMKSGIIEPINTGASPSFLEYLNEVIIDSLNGKVTPHQVKTATASKTTKFPIPATLISNAASKLKAKSKKASVRVKLKSTTGDSFSIVNLQNLLNAQLVQRVKENMGNGTRKDILNLRTGRFAESVKVERISQSREGMITAFYTYMRNPYATFSQGGRQQVPKSRDPKLLISKSIREIAQEKVTNRLRAVLV
jgi:hypothetical protein